MALPKGENSTPDIVDACALEERILFSASPLPLFSDGQIDTNDSIDLDGVDEVLGHLEAEIHGISDSANQVSEPGDDAPKTPDFDGPEPFVSIHTQRHELLVIDSTVPDFDELIEDLKSELESARDTHIEILVLDSRTDGIQAITDVLHAGSNWDAVHIVSHGAAGEVQLGGTVLSGESLLTHLGQLASWNDALNENADLLIYGCDVANGEFGEQFVEALQELTGADVAASDDLTGHESLGADWEFEFTVGVIETELAFSVDLQAQWQHALDTYTVTSTADDGSVGTLRWAIGQSNATTTVDDVIRFNISISDSGYVDPDSTPGNGDEYWSIQVGNGTGNALTAITDTVTIDATTQPGGRATPRIELDGTLVTNGDQNGFTIETSGTTIRGFVINRFLDDAIEIDTHGGGNIIVGNYMGTDVTGLLAGYGNQFGITVKSDGNIIGGTTDADRNIIAGNSTTGTSYGIGFWQDADSNTVQGNYVGLGADGSTALSNRFGLTFQNTANTNQIGGSGADEGNVISGNATAIYMTGSGVTDNVVEGNLIGTNSDGTAEIGSSGNSININNGASDNRIGGIAAGNVIAGSGGDAITIWGSGTTGNEVQGNYIGTDVSGTMSWGSANAGVAVSGFATDNRIGGVLVGEGNVIAYNDGDGVRITDSNTIRNTIRGNSIYGNVGMGIELGSDGPTTNDGGAADDGDTGPNDLTNTMDLHTVTTNGSFINFTGFYDGLVSQTLDIDFYANSGRNATGYSQGERFVGSTTLTVGATGYYQFNGGMAGVVNEGEWVTIVITDAAGNSSEFSRAVLATDALGVVVTTAADTVDGDVSDLDSLRADVGADGYISLREAILASNVTSGVESILFDISTDDLNYSALSNSYLIQLSGSVLPHLDEAVSVDGTSQWGFDGTPVIDLDGNGLAGHGFQTDASNLAIRGLAIRNFDGYGIHISGSSTHTIQGNYIGTDIDGLAASANTAGGIHLSGGADDVTIGGTGQNEGNLIAFNQGDGIESFDNGQTIQNNVIHSNTGSGIRLATASGNTITGNHIGTDAVGTASGLGNGTFGIELDNSANNQIGGSAAADRNVISGNALEGISIWNAGSTLNTIQGNYIGVDSTGNTGLGNNADGIVIGGGAHNNTIGGDRTSGEGNVISGQLGATSDGIEIDNAGADNNKIYGNYIGTNFDGTAAIANGRYGVVIYNGVQGTRVGGGLAGQGNIISGNTSYGVIIDGNGVTTTSGNYVQGNHIGLNAAGDAPIANLAGGIRITSGAQGNFIGGDWNAGQGNVISGNGGTTAGIYITGDNSDNNTIQGNLIGLSADGSTPFANDHGIWNQDADGTIIGGDHTAGLGNVISGNITHGIYLADSSTSVMVQGNWIGTNAAGDGIIGNGFDGVRIEGGASGNTIGGDRTANLGNVISGNTQVGVHINSGDNNVVQGNWIGTNAAGDDLGNTLHGVYFDFNSSGNLIGSTTPAFSNTIAFNSIGVGYKSTAAGSGNSVLRNSIYSNNGLGIDIEGGLVEDGNGVTDNDTNDGDTGPNDYQNYPRITQADLNGTVLTVSGSLDTDGTSTQYRIEFFGNAAGTQKATNGEGHYYLGTHTVTTDVGGMATFSGVALSGVTLSDGDYVTATATRIEDATSVLSDQLAAYGSTSEFADNVAITGPPNAAPVNTIPALTATVLPGTVDGPSAVGSGDFNGDGFIDIVAGTLNDTSDSSLAWYQNDGAENFTFQMITTVGMTANGIRDLDVADIDGDGDLDIVTVSENDNRISWWSNDGAGNFTQNNASTSLVSPRSVDVVDFDNDGDMDIIAGGADNGDTIHWLDNDGSEVFVNRKVTDILTADFVTSVQVADVDGDTDLDIVAAAFVGDAFLWFEHQGGGTFVAHTIDSGLSVDGAAFVAVADIDNDGDVDVATAANYADVVSWYKNDGSGNFGAGPEWTVASDGARTVLAADLEGDGDIDLIAGSGETSQSIVAHLNDGAVTPGFTTQIISSTSLLPLDMHIADIDSDGDLDLVEAAFPEDEVRLYENYGGFQTTADTLEDTPLTFSAANGNQISISDADAGGASVQVTLTMTNGTISLAQTTGLTITPPADGSDDATIEFTGTIADINAALDGMTFVPSHDFVGTANIEINTNDLGNSGTGGVQSDIDNVSINVIGVNDAPVLTDGGSGTIFENGSGLAPFFTTGTMTDSDSTNFAGGTMTFSIASGGDGSELLSLGAFAGVTTSGSDVLVSGVQVGTFSGGIGGTDLVVTFDADATPPRVESVFKALAIRVNSEDPTPGIRSLEVVLTDGDGGTSNIATASVTFNAVNDAPVLDNSGDMSFTSITEDQTGNGGQTVASIIASAGGDRITDVDSGAFEGIAITAIAQQFGNFQYSTNGGSTWNFVGVVSETSALLLGSSDLVRFEPLGTEGGSSSITFRAWDQSSGTSGTKVTTASNGGSNAFSTATEVASISVADVNDAPLLDNSGSPTLTTISEDDAGNAGNTITQILANGGDPITDVDSGSVEGIAISGLGGANGTWQYNIGSGWINAGPVSSTSALILRATDSLRFNPDGTDGDLGTVLFQAWDQTFGLAGTKVDSSIGGGTTAFSTQVEVATLNVTAVNDAPTLDTAGLPQLSNVLQNAGAPNGDLVSAIIASAGGDPITDVDSGSIEGIAVTSVDDSNGTWQYSTNGGSTWNNFGAVTAASAVVLTDTANDMIRFVPDLNYTENASISYRAWDTTDGSVSGDSGVNTGATNAFSTAIESAIVYVEPTEILLWLSTTDDVGPAYSQDPSLVPGLDSWSDGTVIGMGDPGLSFGSGTTTGTFSAVTNFDSFAADFNVDITGLHYVTSNITVTGAGIATGSIDLLSGDVIFITQAGESLSNAATGAPVGWANSIVTSAGDMHVFRAENTDDYSSGYFRLLMNDPSLAQTTAITLAEQATTVGDTVLGAGDFLFVDNSPGRTNDIYWYDSSLDASNQFIDGANIGISDGDTILGLELIEDATTVGGVSLGTGNILATINDASTTIGSNNLSVAPQDVFAFDLTATTYGSGTAAATASMLFDGDGSVNFDANGENLDALSLIIKGSGTNQAPVVSNSGAAVGFVEDGSPTIIDGTITLADADSTDFDGGTLSVGISSGGATGDRLSVWNQGTGVGEIGVSGNDVTYGGTIIGSFSGGLNSVSPLVINLNANANVMSTQALMRNITFWNTSDNPATAARTIDFSLTDGDGGTGNTISQSATVTAIADVPIAVNDNFGLDFDGIDDYVSIADDPTLVMSNTLTMSAWINPDTLGQTQLIINKEGEYEVGLLSDGSIAWAFDNADPDWTWHNTGYQVATNVWTHVAVTYDNGTISTYVNGGLVDEYHGSGPIGDQYVGMDELRIGGRTNNPANQYFDGRIDEVRIWNTARTQGQIQSLMDVDLTGSELALVGYWTFEEGSGTVTADLNGGTNNGTLIDGGAGTAGPQWTGYWTDQDTQINIDAANGVINNDIDGDGDALSISQVNGNGANVGAMFTLPSGANLTVGALGAFIYDPNGAFDYLVTGQIATDTFTYQVDDGNGGTDTATATVTVLGINDAPQASNLNAGESYTEEIALDLTDILVNDVDDANVTVTLTLSDVAAGSLSTGTSGAVTSTFIGGVWTASGAVADINALLAGVTFTPSGDYATDFMISTSVDDGEAAAVTGIKNFSAAPINDAPILTAGSVSSLTVSEDSGFTSLGLGGVSYGPGGGTDEATQTLTYQVTVIPSPTFGDVYLADGTTIVTTTSYTLAQLQGMQFRPANDATGGPSFFSWLVVDDGGTAGGGSDTLGQSIQLNITPVNDAPSVATNTGTTVAEGSTGTVISNTILNEGDADDSGAELTYTVTSFTTNGTLNLNGFGALGLNDTFTQADIDAGNVTYDHDGSESTTDSFDFALADGGEDGATPATGTFNFTITPVNDTPTIATNTGATVAEGSLGTVISNTMLNVGDPDDSGVELSYTVTSVTGNGTLLLSGFGPLGLNDSFTQADIDAGNVTYDHDGSESTTDSFDFVLADGGEDGATPATGTFNFTITPVNDTPTIATNTGATVAEGSLGTVISDTMLHVGDPDDAGTEITYTLDTVPVNGRLFLSGAQLAASAIFTQDDIDAGRITYDHNGTETTSDSFDFTINDGGEDGATPVSGTFFFTITPNNAPPSVATNTGTTVNEGSTGTVISNTMLNEGDPDDDGAELTYTITSVTTNGVLSLSGFGDLAINDTFTQADIDAGNVTYDHDGSESTTDSFDFALADGGEDGATPATGTFNFTITPVNDSPTIATNTGATVAEGSLGTVISNTMLNVGDPDDSGVELTYTVSSATTNGTLTLSGFGALGVNDTFTQADIDAGNVTYDHDGSETISDRFDFSLADGGEDGSTLATGTFNFTITPINDVPTATNDSFTVNEGASLTTPSNGVLNNDTDPDGDLLTATLVTSPMHGVISFNADGSFTYTHDGSETTVDTFSYQLSDGMGGTDTATVTINILPVNDVPVASPDTYNGFEGGTINVSAVAGVLSNDFDADGDFLSVSLLTAASNGSVTLNPDGSFTYLHDGSETTSDSFTYTLTDGMGGTAIATVNITVAPRNDGPAIGTNTGMTVLESSLGSVITNGMLHEADVDDGGTGVRYTVTSSVTNGTLRLNGVAIVGGGTFTQADIDFGRLTYDHDGSETLSDSFAFALSDGGEDGAMPAIGTFDITVIPTNDEESISTNNGVTVDEGSLGNPITPATLRTSDVDTPSNLLVYVLTSEPINGTLYLGGFALSTNDTFTQADIDAGQIEYDHDGSETISDGFDFEVDDGQGTRTSGSFGIVVNPVNDSPIAQSDSYTIDEGATLSRNVLDNDSDVDGGALTATIVTAPSNGSLTLSSDGTFTYTHDGTNTASDSFEYQVHDGNGGTSNATVTISVNIVNSPPESNPESASTTLNRPIIIDLLANDTDIDGDGIQAVIITEPSHGTLTLNSDGSFTFTPDSGFVGVDSFTYQATDGLEMSDPTTVELTVFIPAVDPTYNPTSETDTNSNDDSDDESSDDDDSDLPALILPPVSSSENDAVESPTPETKDRTVLGTPTPLVAPSQKTTEFSIGSSSGYAAFYGTTLNAASIAKIGQAHVSETVAKLQPFVSTSWLWEQMEEVAEQLEQEQTSTVGKIILQASVTSLGMGYVLWTLRSGYLLASVMSAMPAWHRFDPLPIVSFATAKRRDLDAKKNRGSLVESIIGENLRSRAIQ